MKNNNLLDFLVVTSGLFFILILIISLLTITKATAGIILFLSFLFILFIGLLTIIILQQKLQVIPEKKSSPAEPKNITDTLQLQFCPTIPVTEVPIIKKLPKKKDEYLLTEEVIEKLEEEKEEIIEEGKAPSEIDEKKMEILRREPKLLANIIKTSWLTE